MITPQTVYNLLRSAGLSKQVAIWATAQAAFESAAFTSAQAKDDNNLSGILFIGKPQLQRNATASTKHRLTDSGAAVAHFASLSDWARDFARVLSMGVNPPVNASSLSEYVLRLKMNNYFGKDSSSRYQSGIETYLKKMGQLKDNWFPAIAAIAAIATAFYFFTYKKH